MKGMETMAEKTGIHFPELLMMKGSAISRCLEEAAFHMGVDLDPLTRDEQVELMRRALEIRAAHKERAERFQADWVGGDE